MIQADAHGQLEQTMSLLLGYTVSIIMSNDEAFWTLEVDTIPKVIVLSVYCSSSRTHGVHNSKF